MRLRQRHTAQRNPNSRGFTKDFKHGFLQLWTTIFSQKTTCISYHVYYHSFLQCTRRFRLEIRKGCTILKVPWSEFWCPGCARPAAEKLWRRHWVFTWRFEINEMFRLEKNHSLPVIIFVISRTTRQCRNVRVYISVESLCQTCKTGSLCHVWHYKGNPLVPFTEDSGLSK